MKRIHWLAPLLLLGLVLGLAPQARCDSPALPKKTALDDYVQKPDSTFQWNLIKTVPGDGITTYIVDLKSQTWRKEPEVDHSVWQHWLVIVKPNEVKYDTGFLMIGGGKNDGKPPTGPDLLTAMIAKQTQSVVAELKMIPNQPLIFNQDGKPRSEDDLLAYCWVKFMDTGDATWLARLAMVKSAVRAMDAVTALLGSDVGGRVSIKKFVVAGGSKRGWTTWLTGVVDPRVVAIIPIVIDVVNVRACSVHHYCAYGFWAPAIGDYTNHKIFERSDSPQYAELLKIEDPYFYRHRLTMPKYLVNAAGDQYFPPDSSQFYWDELEGVKYLRYVPNADHSLKGSDAPQSIVAFYRSILKNSTLPKYSWKLQPDGSLRVVTDTKPLEVNLWQANNPKARDFRVVAIDKAYRHTPLTRAATSGKGEETYVAKVDKPAEGWTAFFVELVFDSGDKEPYKFTTQVYITPDTLPHSLDELKPKK